MDFPLGFHDKALLASVANNCAGEQDKYWEMHHDIFENQRGLGEKLYVDLATKMKLDIETFKRCLGDAKQKTAVYADIQRGEDNGVTGTPKFFVGRLENNVMKDIAVVSGAVGIERFSATIESKMK